ncbi:MAG: hypothetical protein JRH18_06170 [Deltaproteobacteria bacterium]|nr:hypothetical protein [Deltaproteobacteria bacterium]MBW1960045.1 hypothetical protein [Deltaproteobacteria bacterium]MBW2151237.1 hypothetical protein [Deltaproteobacteria bacterium]
MVRVSLAAENISPDRQRNPSGGKIPMSEGRWLKNTRGCRSRLLKV